MGMKTTKRQRDNRRREVYNLVVGGQWNPATRKDLARKHRLTEWTLWQDYRWIMEKVKRPADLPPTPDEEKNEFLLRLRDTISSAKEEKKYSSVASLMAVEAKVLGLAQPTRLDVHHSGQVQHAHLHVAALSDADLQERLTDLRSRTPALPGPSAGAPLVIDVPVAK